MDRAKANPIEVGMEFYEHVAPLQTMFLICDMKLAWELQAVLLCTTGFCAMDPRDKIFALLGLCVETQDDVSRPPQLLADFTKVVEELFRDAKVYLISATQNLDLLLALVD